MDRRAFMKAAAGTAALTGATSGATSAHAGGNDDAADPVLTDREFRVEMRRLRRELRKMEREDTEFAKHLRSLAPTDGSARAGDRWLRSSMKTLLFADLLKDLDDSQKADPELAATMREHVHEVDYAVKGALDWVTSLDPDDVRYAQERLRNEPDLPMKLAEKLDSMAGENGIGRRQRRQMRKMVSHLQWRLQRQPLQLVLDDALDKTERRFASLAQQASSSAFLNLDTEGLGGLDEWAAHSDEFEREFLLRSEEGRDPQTGRLTHEGLKTRAKRRLRLAGLWGVVGAGLILVGAATGEVGVVLILAGLFPMTMATVLFFVAIVTYLLAAERKWAMSRNAPKPSAPPAPPQPAAAAEPAAPASPAAPAPPAASTSDEVEKALQDAREALEAAKKAREAAEAGQEGADDAIRAADEALKEAQESLDKARESSDQE